MVRDYPERGCRDHPGQLKVHRHSIEGELGASRKGRGILEIFYKQ
jgi:hypothetical protein